MATLFSPDRPDEGRIPWYEERTARCIEQIWRLSAQLVAADTDVVLEIGLIRRRDRERFYRRVDAAKLPLEIYVIDAPRDQRRERVARRNAEQGETFSMVVPPEFFELASDLWEPLEDDERTGRAVRVIET
jgi:predicted kinase